MPLVTEPLTERPLAAETGCPFHRHETGACQAAVSDLKVTWRRRQSHCAGEDYDVCAVFLSRLLRTCRSDSSSALWLLSQK